MIISSDVIYFDFVESDYIELFKNRISDVFDEFTVVFEHGTMVPWSQCIVEVSS